MFQSSFAADGSEYSSLDSGGGGDDGDDDSMDKRFSGGRGGGMYDDDQDDTPTIELQPLPLSKNAGNRFVAIIWDRLLSTDGSGEKDALDLHYDRIELTEEHVMYCRKSNLYNETFNTGSMVDILWSLQMYVG